MFLNIKDWQRNVVVFLIVSSGVMLGLSFAQVSGAASIFYPAAGMTVGLYYIFNKRIAPGLFLAIFVTHFVYRLFAVDEPVLQSIALALFFLLAAVFEVIIFNYVIKKTEYKIEGAFSSKESWKFVLAMLLASFFGALFGAVSLYLHIDAGIDLIKTFGFFFIGDLMGIVVFASLIMNHYYHDEPMIKEDKSNVIPGLIYLFTFGMLVFFIFGESGNDFLDFETFQVFIVLMYVISAFVFSFRMIGISNILFLIAFNFLYFINYTGEELLYEAIRTSLFLIIVSSIASVIRIIILDRRNHLIQMKTAKDSLEKIIVSTNDLVKSEHTIPEEDFEFGKAYLRNMFEIACEVYPNFDRASCNTFKGEYVEFVAVKGYSLEHLNNLNFLASEFVWELSEPNLIVNTDYDKVFEETSNENEFVNSYGRLQKSIRFTVNIGENKYAGISFDIYENSDYDFNEKDLENYKSFQTLMNSYFKIGILNNEKDILKDDIVISLVRTLELYDLYTGGHSEQVADLCAEFGKHIGLPSPEIRELYWAGIVHDIGKIGLPADVLNLSRRLTVAEFEQVKEHPRNGYEILTRSQSLSEIADVVLHHHEWWNGKGYPDGLKGEKIPYHSRILHVCDAVDAMAKDRIYRKALTEEQIILEIEHGKGSQFNPEVADQMIEFIQSGVLHKII